MSNEFNQTRTELSAAKQALLRARLKQGAVPKEDRISRRTSAQAPLSFAQQRLWFLDQFYPLSCAYNVARVFRLSGKLHLDALQHAVNSIVQRHEILRTTFRLLKEEPVQFVSTESQVKMQVSDLRSNPVAEREAKADQIVTEEVLRPFDLSADLMLRATLLRLDEDEHVLVLMTHHIVSDGWSKGVMFRELTAFYNAAVNQQSVSLPDLPIQYADFAIWQKKWVREALLQKQVVYWKKQLEGAPALLELPTDYPRPAVQGFAGATESYSFPNDLLQNLKSFSQREGMTLFMTLLAAFQVLLARYTNQEDVVVGTPIAGRSRPEIEPLIGDFVNMLAMRTDLSGNPSFRDLLRRVKEGALQAYDNQDLPFESLVEELEHGRDMSRAPIFQTIFILETAPPAPPAMEGLSVRTVDYDPPTAKNDLILILADTPDGLKTKLEYRTDLFTKASIDRLARHFQTLLESILADPNCPISRLPIMPREEQQQVLTAWNDTATGKPLDRCIYQLFESQCERTPNAVAVQFHDRKLTYRELNERANQLAHYLRKLGVVPDSRVGICVHRSPEMMVGLLGIMKAGGAYVPLDPTYPRERLEFMLEDGGAGVLVTQTSLLESLSSQQARVVCIDGDWNNIARESAENPSGVTSPENLSYVIFTSGSTGRPKGVQLQHRNVVNFINSVQRLFALTEHDTYLGVGSMSFDASVLDFYLPLSVGARLVIVDVETTRDGSALAQTMSRAGVSAMHATPSTWRSLVDAGWPGDRKLKIFSGGEALPWDLADLLLPRCLALWNLYGPTETAVYSAIHKVVESDGTVLVGRPLDNTQIYILDSLQQPTPIGVPGEICIAGSGVARGYLNRPELTAERFVKDPFSADPGARMYRTGDLGRFRPDGIIQCLGRVDHQVKLRGFRIELGEIESVLMQYPGVRQAVADVRTSSSGDKRLVAYVVFDEDDSNVVELRGFLKTKLPDYMIPSSFIVLDKLPVSPSGKLNRRALPEADDARPELARAFVAPSTPVEQAVAEIFSEVLDVRQVGIHDDFFELGGHSLLATRVVSRLRDRFQIEMTPRFLFESPTVSAMSARISELLVQESNPEEMAALLAELAELEEQ
jgi:amino acid adenylation domain-containing protein